MYDLKFFFFEILIVPNKTATPDIKIEVFLILISQIIHHHQLYSSLPPSQTTHTDGTHTAWSIYVYLSTHRDDWRRRLTILSQNTHSHTDKTSSHDRSQFAMASSQFLQLPAHSSQFNDLLTGYSLLRSRLEASDSKNALLVLRSPLRLRRSYGEALRPVPVRVKCFSKSTEEKEAEVVSNEGNDENNGGSQLDLARQDLPNGSANSQRIVTSTGDSLSLGIREPVYEVIVSLLLGP